MNQILDYTPNGGNSRQSKPRRTGGSDNIVRIFAIILIVFAIALIAIVGRQMISNKEEVSVASANEEKTEANIEVSVEDTEATIEVTHDKPIEKLIYSWNNSPERVIKCTEKYVKETTDIPSGDNTLHIKVIDSNKVETTYDKEISAEKGIDVINPVIELSPSGRKLKIHASDETLMDYLTYRWNDGDEETVYAEEGSKEINIEIEVLKGKNDLTIAAIDGSNNTTYETKQFIGLTKPEIKVTLSEDGSSVNIKAEHENGIEEVLFNFNDVDYTVDLGGQTPQNIEFNQDLKSGVNNRIILTVKSVDGTESKFDANCTYGEDGSITRNDEESNDNESEQNTNSNR